MMNKNKILTLTLGLAIATASTTVYADTTNITDSTAKGTTQDKLVKD